MRERMGGVKNHDWTRSEPESEYESESESESESDTVNATSLTRHSLTHTGSRLKGSVTLAWSVLDSYEVKVKVNV